MKQLNTIVRNSLSDYDNVAYLDGERPSLIMTRGYYTRSVIAAWDWQNGHLENRWVFDSNDSINEKFAG